MDIVRKLMTFSILLLTIGIFYKPLYELAVLSFKDPLLSHSLMIPIVSLYIFYLHRKAIFSNLEYAPKMGIGLMVGSLIIVLIKTVYLGSLDQNDALSVSMASLVIWVVGSFLLVCGPKSFIEALFPLLLLAFMIPLPSFVLEPVVRFLQLGSTYAARGILILLGVPAIFDGIFITLQGITVEVAEECSGIRSAVALLILSTVGGYLFLESNWRRFCLVLCMVPITILKNGMRIDMLTLLGSYVDMSYLTDSALHSAGGKPFFVLAVLMVAPVFWMLKRSESEKEKT